MAGDWTATGCTRPLLVAHRGFSKLAPENTLAAFRKALELGIDACECDVHVSRDHEVVVIHDATVDRTTNGTGRVADFRLSQLQELDAGSWKGLEYAGEPLPTLRELLLLVQDKCRLLIEVKEAAALDPTLELLRIHDFFEQAMLISFDFDVCRIVRSRAPQVAVKWLWVPQQFEPDEQNAMVRKALAGGITGLGLCASGLNSELIRYAHERCLPVWTWTIDEADQMVELAKMGVDGLTSNDPLLAQQTFGVAPA